LTISEIDAWRRLTMESPDLQSPFFQPEYVQAIGEHRSDVEVAVLEEGGQPVGFFSYQRFGRYSAMPVGGKLTDFQGVVGRLPGDMSAVSMLRQCNLKSCTFDHLHGNQIPFNAGTMDACDSPYLDLSQGWESYVNNREQSGSRIIRETERKRRKLRRELGEVRFVPVCNDDDEVFWTLLDWKSKQRTRTGTFDVLKLPWVVNVLQSIRRLPGPNLTGQLSALYAGDALLAAHFGMGTPTMRHFWFAAYNSDFASYSAGAILFLDLARFAAEQNIRRFDLGKGTDRFKRRVASDSQIVFDGGVDTSPVRRCGRRLLQLTRKAARRAPFRGFVRASKRILDSYVYK